MAEIGKISEFDEVKESFVCYEERMSQYFIANDVEDGKKVPIFLTVVGPQTYGLLKNLLAPVLPSTHTYDVLIDTLKRHFTPTPLVIAERYKFHRRDQNDGESVADYMVALRKLSTHCDFGDFLNQALRDRLVCGLKNEVIQKRLLTTVGLTLRMATDTAQAMELAEKDSMELKGTTSPAVSVNKLHRGKFGGHTSKSKSYGYSTNGYSGNQNKSQRHYTGNRQSFQSKNSTSADVKCFRCGNFNHKHFKCPFRNEKCFMCQDRGHISKMCNKRPFSTNNVPAEEFGLWSVYFGEGRRAAYKVRVLLNSKEVEMEVDTGAALSVMPANLYIEHFSNCELKPSSVVLKTYSGEVLNLMGELEVTVTYNNQTVVLPVIVVKGANPALIGRNWLQKLKLDWSNIFKVQADVDIQPWIKKFPTVFAEGFGVIKGHKANIRLKETATPIFYKPRPIPYALKEAVERELDRLESSGVISKVDYSPWATPIVVVPKSDHSIRICGDYKVTVNKCIEVQQYPLPNAEDIFATLAGGTVFSKLDLSSAYQQLMLDKQSELLLTWNTHRGLYRVHRLAFGVASAPAIFQSTLEQILHGMEGVMCRLDDILISAPTTEQHLDRVEMVLQRLEKFGVRLKLSKCVFMQPSVNYLGYKVDSNGIHPLSEKVEAINNAPVPTNVSELKSFLGLLNYYGKFLPNLSTMLNPLHELLQKDTPWLWSKECDKAFMICKQKLTDSKMLVHYDVNKPLKIACDASSYGLGSVISHVDKEGNEQPIAFASRTLNPSERNYSQLEKEALSIIYGIKKFHQYLYGRTFILETDHKPLTTILGPYTAVPTLAAARLQRWALILSAYQYQIVYRSSVEHGNADALSRNPLEVVQDDSLESDLFYFSYVNELPINSHQISEATRKDRLMCKVLEYVKTGWPSFIEDPELKPYFIRRNELSTDQNCILWGMRVIIPGKFQQRLLDHLHEVHPGMCRMKSLARSYLWWPNLDDDIEKKVRGCQVCLSVRKSPPSSPLLPWKWPSRIWQRLHIDYAEFQKQNYLIVIDSHSKWLEVFNMPSTTSARTIEVLRALFSSYGIPEDVVSDNGPQFKSAEFEQFMMNNGIRHICTPPYHPASNGAAERSVQTIKQSLLKQVLQSNTNTNESLKRKLDNFLLMYRVTPHSVTGVPPAELFLKRQLRTRFSMLKPVMQKTVETKQESQIKAHDVKVKNREFQAGQLVYVKNNREGVVKWIPAKITRKLGLQTFLVRVFGKIRYVHVDHLLPSHAIDCKIPEMVTTKTDAPKRNKTDDYMWHVPDINRPNGNVEHRQPNAAIAEPRRSSRPRRSPQKLNL
ncbi:hypothetical protein SNE40_011672 [Patella caerulea]|uniref:RNA-directed DNA polymerase n=1 Tax=Patella caerulea TaxID=87958 RepID=A0AAN8JPT3_PATCE